MHIEEVASGQLIEVIIEKVSVADYAIIRKNLRFGFDWNQFLGEVVYKLVPAGTNDMAGLMALTDHPQEGLRFIEVKLIESAKENIGAGKKYDRVPGILLAFACRESFKKGYNGTLFLIPKTSLIPLYRQKYGFLAAGRGLYLEQAQALKLMNNYL
ncbi:MAG: hypothetical protein P0Y53_04135 [Candidatus Pseudobacter hemicellulosilyticus]|uniref:Uncharacterized protein n=1 Tax=Candidatus Pseudobacter hemicellulosilyticus TaxID=3121375 RepID=A0AAJ6BHW5_9BACT|nr:MAG: hypothetical protein P0Y53_04135 [Pseudobacter sp.]